MTGTANDLRVGKRTLHRTRRALQRLDAKLFHKEKENTWSEAHPEHSPHTLAHLGDTLICLITEFYFVLTELLPDMCVLDIPIF